MIGVPRNLLKQGITSHLFHYFLRAAPREVLGMICQTGVALYGSPGLSWL